MLPEDVLQLLTAAVDGELTPCEVVTVRALLVSSPEAKAAFRQLKADRQRLRRLPVITPPADLYSRVMARLPARPPGPVEVARPTHRPRRGSLVPLGVAASLLMAVMAGSFAFFLNQQPPSRDTTAVAAARSGTQVVRQWANVLPRDSAPPPSAPPTGELLPEAARVAIETPAPPDVAPEPRPVVRDVLTFPPLPDVGKLDMARVRVPFLAAVAEFDREDVQDQFVAELGQDPAFRIDLFARDPGKGAELFQTAAKAAGVTLFADRVTGERVQKKLAAAYVVYTDSLTATDLRSLLTHLAAADGKAAHTFDAVHVTAAGSTDQRDLRDVLGIDPGLWKRPTAGEPKSVASGTANQLTRNLTDPTRKGGDRFAVLLTFAPTQARTPPAASTELRQFLGARGDRKPNAVPVLIVIRQANG